MPCQLMKFSVLAEFLGTISLVFTLPKDFRTNTTKVINNAKTAIMIILIHGLSITLHMEKNNAFSSEKQVHECFIFMDLHFVANTLVCITRI